MNLLFISMRDMASCVSHNINDTDLPEKQRKNRLRQSFYSMTNKEYQ